MKRSMKTIFVIALCLVFCGYPVSTTVYGAHDRVEEEFNGALYSLWCEYHDVKILSNGATAFFDELSVILVKPDGTSRINLDPPTPEGYDFAAFGVDYSAQSGQYAVMYGLFPQQKYKLDAVKSACVALFDEGGKSVKQIMLDGLYCEPWVLHPPTDFGFSMRYRYCEFSTNTDILYAGGLITENVVRKWRSWELKEDYEDYFMDIYEFTSDKYYKINLEDGSYTAISKLPGKEPEIPVKVQYNKMGTYIYTVSGDSTETLAFLDGDYIMLSYSINLDGSVQVIFGSDVKTDARIHPMTRDVLRGSEAAET